MTRSKFFLATITYILVLGCSQYRPTSSSIKSGRLKIDPKLSNHLFEFMPYGVHGDPRTGIQTEFVSNARIFDLNNQNHKAFDTCQSFFLHDTLVIEFRDISSFLNQKLIIKVKNSKYWGLLLNEDNKTSITGTPKSLVFRNKVKKLGQEIFGECLIDFKIEKLNKVFTYSGAFRCIVQ